MTRLAICYATQSGILRWVIGSREGGNLRTSVGLGEAIVICDHTEVVDANGNFQESLAQQKVDAITGHPAQSPLCAVVDVNNNVVGMIRADPALDTLPDSLIIQAYSRKIGIDCTYNPATGLFSTPRTLIPGSDRDGVVTPPTVQPPAVIPKP